MIGIDEKCPTCGSGAIYFRQTLKQYVCKKCGTAWPKEQTTPKKV